MVEGSSYTFSVTAEGTAPLSYQWRRDSVSLSAKTNATLPLTLIQTNAAGVYSVVITNADGAVTSAPASLTVRLATDPLYPTPQDGWAYVLQGNSAAGDPVDASLDGTWDHSTDFWTGEGRGVDSPPAGGVSSTNGILTLEDAVFSGSGLNRRIYLTHNLTNEPAVTNASTLLSDGVTLTFRARLTPPTDPWIEITNAPNGLVNNSDGKGMFGIRQSGASGMILGFSLNQATEDLSATTAFNFGQPGLHMNSLNGNTRSSAVDPGEGGTLNLLPLDPAVFHEFWITVQDNGADPGTHRVSVYLDGSLTPTVFNVTAGVGVDGPASDYLALGMGSTAQRGAVDVDFFGYKPGVIPPSAFNQPLGFSFQPTNVFAATGQLATFSVAVTGTPPYGFQWFRDGSPIAGATQSSYATGPVVPGDEGAQFVVVVTNELSSVTSSPPAVLHLLTVPAITAQPQSLTVTNGDPATFSVTVSSGTSPSYQWRLNGINLTNQTNATLVLVAAGPGDAGNYDVVASNSSGSVTSAPAVLSVVLFDFGDAPDPGFPTLKASNGARHVLLPGIYLGTTADPEVNGQPDASAAGDDSAGDDEDGVSFLGPLRAGQMVALEVIASTNGFLQAWVDFDRNGNWDGAGEQIFTNLALVAGTNALSFAVPPAASPGAAFTRFRFSTQANLPFDGPAPDGEVEDYAVTLSPVADLGLTLADGPDPVAAGASLSYSIVVSNAGPSSAANPVVQDVLPPGVTFVSALPSQGTCSLDAGVVHCTLGLLPGKSVATIALNVVPAGAGTLTNTASVSNTDFDLMPANNAASTTTSVLDSPAITAQPQSLTVTNGATATFSVSATGAAPLAYRWRRAAVDLPGATNASLIITNVQPADAGEYTVRVDNSIGFVVSAPATLTVLVPPAITVQPSSRTNLAGSTATFTVGAAGSDPLAYQWFFNGAPVAAGTSDTLVVAGQVTNAGSYRVVITNVAGVVTSSIATLTVIEMDFGDAPGIYPTRLSDDGARHRIAPGIFLGARVDFEPDALLDAGATGDDLLGNDDEDGVTFTSPLRVGQTAGVAVVASTNGVLNAWIDYGRDGSWADAGDQIFTNRNLAAGTNNLTFVIPGTSGGGSTYARFRFATASGLSFVGEATNGEVEDYEVDLVPVADIAVARVDGTDPVATGSNEIFAITVTNAGPSVATGVSLTDTLPAGVAFVSAVSTQGGCIQSAGTVVCSIGLMNTGGAAVVTVTVVPAAAGLLTNLVTVGANQADLDPANNTAQAVARVLAPPLITSDPVSQTVTNGATAMFSVTATGTSLSYQWRRDGLDLPGATNASLSIPNAQATNQGSYTVRITNAVASVVSAPATLTVLSPITITTQPQSQTVGVGSSPVFTVAATGSAPLSYQWDYNGAPLPGETATTLTLVNVQTNQAGNYRVRVSNSFESVTSLTATLTVLMPPSFNPQPASRTNLAGTTATLVSAVEGSSPISLQWFFNATNRLAAQTNASLILPNVQASQAGGYTLVASNVGGLATSVVAVLTVLEVDFGDAPESLGYPTTLSFNGARHVLLPGMRLGSAADFETNGLPDALARGDDLTGVDDEDGVTFLTQPVVGGIATAAVVASTNGFLDAWIDFNHNGTWADPEDQVLLRYPLSSGTNLVPVPISGFALLGGTFARFRYSATGGLSYDGLAPSGEVEDYSIILQPGVDLAVTVTDSPDPVVVTSNMLYTVVVTNRGPAAATGVLLTNTLPASMTFLAASPSQGSCSNASGRVICNLGTIGNAATASVAVGARANAAGTFVTSASATANEGEIVPADNVGAQTTSSINPPAAFSNPAAIAVADATSTAPGLGSPYPSTLVVSGLTSVVYKVTVTLSNLNHGFASDLDILLVGPGGQSVMLMSDCGGNSVINGLTLSFDDAAGFPLPSGGGIAPGTYRPSNYEPGTDPFPSPAPAAPFGSTLSAFAGTDPNGTWSLYAIDDFVNDTGSVGSGWRLNISTADPIADLAVTSTDLPPAVALGSNLVFTVTVTNRGPAAASAVRLTNALPPGVTFLSAVPSQGTCAQQGGVVTCDLANLAPSAIATATVTVTPAIAGGLTNRMSAGASQLDLVPGNNVFVGTTTARPATDVLMTQAASTNLVLLGQSLTCTLNVTNRGPNPATNVRLTDLLPPGVSFISATSTQGGCANDAGIITCNLGGLPINGNARVTVAFTPSAVGLLTNAATVVSDEIDSAATNNAASVTAIVTVIADLAVSVIDSPDPAAIGSPLTYAITVTNQGPLAASLVQVTNRLPSSVTFVNATPSQGSCAQAGGIVNCSLGTLANAGQASVFITVTPAVIGSLTSSVTVATFSLDPVASNNAASAVTTALAPPAIVATPQSQTVTNGANVLFSATATGSPPLTYQWQFNTLDITSATNQTLALSNVSLAAAGGYRVRVANAVGAVTSVVATLTVLVPPSLSDLADQLTDEDTPTAPLAFVIGDADSAISSLALTALTSNPQLIPVTNIVFAGTTSNRTVQLTPVHDQSGTAVITVRVTDPGGLTAADTFTLTVRAVNDPPTLADVAAQTVPEDGILAVPLLIGDVDDLAADLRVTAVSSDVALTSTNLPITGTGTNRTLTLRPVTNLFGSATITLTVTDTNGATATNAFLLTVTPVNDPPTILPLTNLVINEDAPRQTVALLGLSGGPTNEPQALQITAESDNAQLLPAVTVEYVPGQPSGSLAFTPATNASGTATVTVTLNDGGSSNQFAMTAFTVTVLPVNDPPMISDIADVVTPEDTPVGPIPFTVSDVDSAISTLQFSVTSTDTNLIALSGVVLGGAGTNRTVLVNPATNRFGSATLAITVSDGSGGAVADTFRVTVTPVNDPPVLGHVPDQLTEEDRPIQISAFVSDPDALPGDLVLSASLSDSNVIESVTVSAGAGAGERVLSLTPRHDQFGATTVTLTLTDGTNQVVDGFLLTVAPVNDAPTLDAIAPVSVAEGSGPRQINLSGISSGASNEVQTLLVTASSSNPALVPIPDVAYTSASPTGTVTFTPAPGATGAVTLTVTVDDGGASNRVFSRSFQVAIIPTNRAPEVLGFGDRTTAEDTPVVFDLIIRDRETAAADLVVVLTSSDTNVVPNTGFQLTGEEQSTNRTLTVRPLADGFGETLLTLTVSDPDGGTNRQLAHLTVGPVNDAPTLGLLDNLILPAGAGAQAIGLSNITSGAANEVQGLTVTALSSAPGLIQPQINYTSPTNFGTLSFTPMTGVDALVVLTVTVQDDGATNNTVSRQFKVILSTASGQFLIKGIARGAGTTDVWFTTTSGHSYVVEHSADLGSGTWHALPAVAGTGGVVLVTDPAAGDEQRFYRVREE